MRTVETIRDEVLHSNDTFGTNDVLDIIDEIVGLKNEQIENLARIIETQEERHDKEKERIIQALEKLSKTAFDMRCVMTNNQGEKDEISYQVGKEYAYNDSIEIVKEGGVE